MEGVAPEMSAEELVGLLVENRGEAHACPYLAGREARVCGFVAESLPGELYQALMDRGFRRSGTFFYRPVCDDCRECVPLRVPVASFARSRSQSRVWRKNQDVRVSVGAPVSTRAKWELYVRYLRQQHDGTMSEDFEAFEGFLYRPCVGTVEFEYRLGRRLVGVSLADACPKSLSSVYCYFEPEFGERSLGTFSVLWEIEHARREGLPYYYLGYYVRECGRMNYKRRFGPYELLKDYEHWTAEEAGTTG